jgi:succinate dehydrogenase/fumarate reductase-like Fe-S protein
VGSAVQDAGGCGVCSVMDVERKESLGCKTEVKEFREV